jgi:hypothetical protein
MHKQRRPAGRPYFYKPIFLFLNDLPICCAIYEVSEVSSVVSTVGTTTDGSGPTVGVSEASKVATGAGVAVEGEHKS